MPYNANNFWWRSRYQSKFLVKSMYWQNHKIRSTIKKAFFYQYDERSWLLSDAFFPIEPCQILSYIEILVKPKTDPWVLYGLRKSGVPLAIDFALDDYHLMAGLMKPYCHGYPLSSWRSCKHPEKYLKKLLTLKPEGLSYSLKVEDLRDVELCKKLGFDLFPKLFSTNVQKSLKAKKIDSATQRRHRTG